MKLLILAVLTVLVVAPRYAFAAGTFDMDGNELLKKCTSYSTLIAEGAGEKSEYVDGAWCLGYITGVLDDHFIWQISEQSPLDPAKHFCLSSDATPDQAIRGLEKWLEDHPARLHERAIDLVLNSLREEFPCHR